MSGDVLFDAVRALRDGAEDAPAKPEETRARVMSSLRERRARRVLMIKTVVPLAAVLVGSLAWAAPGKLPAIWKAVVTFIGTAEPASETDSFGPSSAAPRPRRGMAATGPVGGAPGVNAGAAPALEAPAQAVLNGADVPGTPVASAPPRVVAAAPPPSVPSLASASAPPPLAPAPPVSAPSRASGAPAAPQIASGAPAQAASIAPTEPPAEAAPPAMSARTAEAGPDTHAL